MQYVKVITINFVTRGICVPEDQVHVGSVGSTLLAHFGGRGPYYYVLG